MGSSESEPGRSPRQPSLPRALALAAGAVGIAVLVFVVALAARAQRGGPPPTDVLGSQLPPGWEPGVAGVGQPPPQPAGVPPLPAGSAPAPPPAEPYGQAHPRVPAVEGEAPPAFQEAPTPALGVVPELAPPPPEQPSSRGYTPPRLLSLPEPSYPRAARRMGIEATVVLRVRVSERGMVLDADQIGEPVGHGFEGEAIRSARRARFEPARRDGVPVAGESRLAVRFRRNP